MTKVTQAHIDARREAILGAASSMFMRKGVEAATMQEIAAEAGLSAGAIYRYFPSKEGLLMAVCEGARDEAHDKFRRAAAETDSPRQTLLNMGRAVWDEIPGEAGRADIILNMEAMLAAARRPGKLADSRHEMWSSVIALVAHLLEKAQAAGELEPDIDTRALALTVLACHVGTHVLSLELGDSIDTDSVFDVLTKLLSPSSVTEPSAYLGREGAPEGGPQ